MSTKTKLDQLTPIFAKASKGDFSENLPVLDADDELAQTYSGIQIMIDVVRDKIAALESEIAYRKRIELDVTQRDERFNTTLNTMAEGFQIINFDFRYQFVNTAVTLQARKSKEELLGHTMMEIYPNIEKTELFVHLKRCMHDRVSHQMENEFIYPDGSRNWFELRIEPVKEGVLIFSVDINDRKKIEAEIAQEKAEDEALLASIGDGMLATDRDGKVVLVNKIFETFLGWHSHEIVGKTPAEIITIEDENGQPVSLGQRPLTIALKEGKRVTAMHYLLRKDGSKLPAIVTATPIILEKKIIGAVEILHDITREKELDQAKDEFIFMASHELRTPMTAIKGLTSMILHGDYGVINEELKRPLENISISSNRQIRLINDLLSISRLQTGNMQYNLSNFPIKQVVDEVVESLQPIATDRGIVFKHEHIDELLVQGDTDWVKQILNNLLGNALKFTDKGSITISTRSDKDFEFVVVIDTGAGIDPNDQEKLFERFRQLGTISSKKAIGSGLGLYISRKVARKMGGDIKLEKSLVGEGSTFVFSLPKADTTYAQKIKEEITREMQIASNKKRE